MYIIYYSYNVFISLLTNTTIHINPVHPFYQVSRLCIGSLVDDTNKDEVGKI